MGSVVNLNYKSGLLCSCFILASAVGSYAQEGVASAPPAQASPAPAVQPQPSKPPVAAVARPELEHNTGDARFSVELFGWGAPSVGPVMRTGTANANPNPSDLDFQKKRTILEGGMVSVPIGRLNTFRLSYFQTNSSGNTFAPQDLTILNGDYAKGTPISTSYKLDNLKFSFDYLTWPYPPKDSKFRLKTLFEVQYVNIHPIFTDFTTDSQGNVLVGQVEDTRSIVFPTFGLGVEHSPSRHFRWEASASAFAFPNHSAIWDAHVAGAVRIHRVEILFGAKSFHFKTSPKLAEYFKGTLTGPYIGLRWYP